MISRIITPLLAALYAITAVTADSIDLSKVKFNGITARGGGGCDQQHPAAVSVNGAAVGIVETFPAFSTKFKVGDPITNQREFCQVALDIDYPDGLQYRVKDVTSIDAPSIGSGASAVHQVYYYFSGSAAQSSVRRTFSGPASNDASTSTQTFPDKVWSPCNNPSPLNINNSVQISPGTSKNSNVLNVKYVVFGLEWRRC